MIEQGFVHDIKGAWTEMMLQIKSLSLNPNDGIALIYHKQDLQDFDKMIHAGFEQELVAIGFAWDLMELGSA